MTQLDYKILSPADEPRLIAFEEALLASRETDSMEREFLRWTAKWRRESLAHYLPLGWSFVAHNSQGEIVGYFLAQPLLFFRGMTQTLWVEHLSATSTEVAEALIDLAHRWGKDKHMQKVVVAQGDVGSAAPHPRAKLIQEKWWEMNATRLT